MSSKEIFRSLSPDLVEIVQGLAEEANSRNLRLFLVGGAVRDLLLNRPIMDVDMVLEAPGAAREIVAEVARAACPQNVKIVVHGRFGTVSMESGNGKLDLALARSETYRSPGALPVVEVASLEEDLFRRDFGVNALALELFSSERRAQLEVTDPVGGLRDLDRKQLRILHSESFRDDPTRAFRAARLGPRLGFSLARGTRVALSESIAHGVFSSISGDRIRRELEKVFTDSALGLDPVKALKYLSDWGVLQALDSSLTFSSSARSPIRRLGRAVVNPPWRSSPYRPFVPGLAVWLVDLPSAVRQRVLQRLSVRGETAERIMGFARLRHRRLEGLSKARGRSAVDGVLAGIHEESLYALYAVASSAGRRQIVRWAAEDRVQRVPVTGADLVSLGLEGPALGRVLARIRAGFLDGELLNREEALTLAEELVRRASTRGKTRVRGAKKGSSKRDAE